MKIRNDYDKNPNISASKYLVLNLVFIPRCVVKAVQNGVSSKTARL